MRYLLVKKNSISFHLTLVGISVKEIYRCQVNNSNTVIIDETYNRDITLTFPYYIYELAKILNDYSLSKLKRISDLNRNMIYDKLVDEKFENDLIILSRKDDYKKMSIPYIDKSGKIKITYLNFVKDIKSKIFMKSSVENYKKLRTIIFNTTVLPYVKILI